MAVLSKDLLARRSRVFRYVYFVVTGVRFVSFGEWKRQGEPNPFVAPTYRHIGTRQCDFVEIFDEYRAGPSQNPL